jgi:hypothetical protein
MSKTAATLGVMALSLGLGACAVELSDQDTRDIEQLAGPWQLWLDQPTLAGGFADSPAVVSVMGGAGIFGRALGVLHLDLEGRHHVSLRLSANEYHSLDGCGREHVC